MRVIIKLIMLSTAIALSACGSPNNETSAGGKKLIVTTTNILGDVVNEIVGDSAEVKSLMGPGVDPHLYKPSQGDIELLSRANIIVYNGLHLEGKMQEILEKIGRQKPTISAGAGLTKGELQYPAQLKSAPDPHIWFDVALWSKAVNHVSRQLAKHNSTNSAYYQQRSQAYVRELESLDIWVKEQVNSIPQNRRILITAHDAFGYFGTAYGIEVKGLQGISTMSEYGIKDIQDMTELISSRNIPAVFVETSVPRKALEAVVAGCKQRGHQVSIGGSLYSDALGSAESGGGTYIGMVKSNVNTIVKALR
jgi:manganese/zinc/iron transport system substrate-binding protein